MGPTRVLSAPGGSHVGPINLAIRHISRSISITSGYWKRGRCQHPSPHVMKMIIGSNRRHFLERICTGRRLSVIRQSKKCNRWTACESDPGTIVMDNTFFISLRCSYDILRENANLEYTFFISNIILNTCSVCQHIGTYGRTEYRNGVINSISIVQIFFSESSKYCVPTEFHVHVWQVLAKLRDGETCHLSTLTKVFKRYFSCIKYILA